MKYLLLNKGLTRIFIVVSVIALVLYCFFGTKDIKKAYYKKEQLIKGIEITAVASSSQLLSGGNITPINHAPMNVPAAYGYAAYYCYINFAGGHPEISGDPHYIQTANTNISFKDFMMLYQSDKFKLCVQKKIDDGNKTILSSYISFVIGAISIVLIFYVFMLILFHVTRWLVDGFRKQ